MAAETPEESVEPTLEVSALILLVSMLAADRPEGMLGRPRLEMPSPRDPTKEDS